MLELQQKLYELLKKFDSRAREHGIEYYLGGGSALGAVRHGGFLPWDDDVDLYITRKNYEKLFAVRDDFFDDDFILVAANDIYPRYRNSLVRCVNPNTTAITRARIGDGTPKGVFVELFVLDPIPNSEEAKEEWLKKKWLYLELFTKAYINANPRIERWTDQDIYEKYIQRCKDEGEEVVLRELENELFSVPEEGASEVALRWGLRNILYDINYFKEPRYVPFEDTVMPVPTYAENVLRIDYGDSWMIIPDTSNQVTHNYAENLEIGYEDFVHNYEQYIHAEEVWNSYEARKAALMEHFFANKYANELKRELKEEEIRASLKHINNDLHTLQQFAAESRWDKLEEIYYLWNGTQMSPLFWVNEQCISIDDKNLYYALLPLIAKGGFGKIIKLLNWRQKYSALDENLHLLYDVSRYIQAIYINIDNGDLTSARNTLVELKAIDLPYAKNIYDINLLELILGLDMVDENVIARYKDFAESNPNNGDALFLYAEALWNLDRKDEAESLAKTAYNMTSNGLVRKKIDSMAVIK